MNYETFVQSHSVGMVKMTTPKSDAQKLATAFTERKIALRGVSKYWQT